MSETSGRFYTMVTKHWPRIAAGVVLTLGFIELVAGGLTANSSVEFYLMAWAGATGGLWFLFEKAERALSVETRRTVAERLQQADFRTAIQSLPDNFALLFDRVFGERHLTKHCFLRSCVASIASVAVLLAVALALDLAFGFGADLSGELFPVQDGDMRALGVLAFTLLTLGAINVVPDYLSLLETRWAINLMRRSGRILPALIVDAVLTTIISAGAVAIGMLGVLALFEAASRIDPSILTDATLETEAAFLLSEPAPIAVAVRGAVTFSQPIAIAFYSAFFTSAWLWLYAASVPVARLLLGLNSGVGFLLRVTDVERQPFRSLGFVAVVVTSIVFAAGVPFVLL
jgi:hypothetical protein